MKPTLCFLLAALLPLAAAAQNPLTLVGHYTGEGYYNYFGAGMTTGDFNADGFQEFIIGAAGWNNLTGKNYIYFGDLQFPATPGLTIQGQAENEIYDTQDQNLGDISGDGIADFAICANTYGTTLDSARLCIYFGAEALDTIADWTFYSPFHNTGNVWSVDSCGDVNGDGGNDFIVWLRGITYDTTFCFIFWGGLALDTIPDWTYYEITLGTEVNGLGDVNGDGYADVMLRGFGDRPARVFFGDAEMDTIPDLVFDNGENTAGIGAGLRDINGDGFCDIGLRMHFPDSTLSCDAIYLGGPEVDIQPDVFLDRWIGQASISLTMTCGDFNGDGLGDILSTAGYGFGIAAVQIHLGATDMNPTPDAYLIGSAEDGWGDYLDAGDINGDGRSELMVAEMGYFGAIGEVFLYEGPETWIDYGAGAVSPEELQHYPGWFRLDQNFPNPFNSSTTLHFELGKSSPVNLTIYDLRGRTVKTLLPGQSLPPGGYNVSWNGDNALGQPVSSGIYLVKLQIEQNQQVKKLALLR